MYDATRFSIAICLGLLALGCLTVGAEFQDADIPAIERGETTKEQIEDWFGPPYQRGLEDGQETWTYLYLKRPLSGKTLSRELHIRFDEQGKVESYSYTTNAGELPAR